MEGAIAVQPLVSRLDGFDEYFTSLRVPEHSKINPWFEEFWEQNFGYVFMHIQMPGKTGVNYY